MAIQLTKAKFLAISRDVKDAIKANKYNAKKLGKKHGVSRETIGNVNRLKTWPRFEQFKAAKRAKNHAERSTPEADLAKGLTQLSDNPVEYVTVKQFNDAVEKLTLKTTEARTEADKANSRFDRVWVRLNGFSTMLSAIRSRKPRWFNQED